MEFFGKEIHFESKSTIKNQNNFGKFASEILTGAG